MILIQLVVGYSYNEFFDSSYTPFAITENLESANIIKNKIIDSTTDLYKKACQAIDQQDLTNVSIEFKDLQYIKI